MRIPLLNRRRVPHVSTAAPSKGRMTFYRHSVRQGEVFTGPLPAPSRVAVTQNQFRSGNGVRCFDPSAISEIQNYKPDILAGSVPVLLQLAPFVKVARAVVAFSVQLQEVVTGVDRDALWSAFALPVFEQRLDPQGWVVAWECEAHEGLHLAVPYEQSGMTGSLREETCDCGRGEPRVFEAAG